MGKLVRLELFNFKSYKGHQRIDFGDSYFTSIIGPNGSGKSNCMDAISFVLGIKTAQLRSSHLKELIYRGRVIQQSAVNGNAEDGDSDDGTDGNDPNTAWVMAVYENDQGEEQLWKRTITASGSSEYRINGKLVKADQYNAALEEENILIKARNFLVFQGDVEAIAAQSPKDLTRLIEQISGSLEYKAEYERLKAEQEKAAEASNFNLNRRRGINAEIKQYQEQKTEAENYAKKAQDRDKAIVTHILWKLFHFQQNIEKNKAEIERHQVELREGKRIQEKYEGRLEAAKKEGAVIARDSGKIDRAIKRREADIKEKETSLVPIEEKIAVATQNIAKYTSRLKEIERDHTNQQATVESYQEQLNKVEKTRAQWEAEQKKLAEKSGAALSQADLAEYKKLSEAVSAKTATDQAKIDNYTRQMKTDEEAVNSLKSKVEAFEFQLNSLKAEVSEMEERRNESKDTVESLTKEIKEKKKEHNALTSERHRQFQQRTELEEKLRECMVKLHEVEDGQRESRREQRMRETVASLKRIFPGVKGRIFELCKPVQKKYSEAVTTVLGRHIDSIVVDNERTAQECIVYLREQRLGQATFIPLDTIQVKPINSNLKGMHRGMRMALDTIEYDAPVETAMQYVCGNSVICDDMKIAKYICFEKGVEVKAVTLKGVVIHKGGLMTGGKTGGNARRFEDHEAESARKIRDNIMAQLAAIPKSHRRNQQEEALESELAGLEQKLIYTRELVSTIERNYSSKAKELKHTQAQLDKLRPQYASAVADLEKLKERIATLKRTVEAVQDSTFAAFCKRLKYENIRIYEQRQGSLQSEAAQKRLEFTTHVNKLKNSLQFEQSRLNSTAQRIATMKASMKRDETLKAEQEHVRDEIKSQIDEIKSAIDILTEEQQAKEELLEQANETVNEAKRKLAKQAKVVEAISKEITGLESEIERNASGRYAVLRRCKLEEIRIPLATGSLEKLPIEDTLHQGDPDAMDLDDEDGDPDSTAIQRVAAQDFGIEVDFDGLEDRYKEDGDEKIEEEITDRISVLTSELDKMAPNMKAIERLEGVKERLQETDEEFEKARKEAKAARDRFQAIKDKRFDLFQRAFNHISEQIQGVYKELTRSTTFPVGGTAYLDMEDTDEPYLDGIKYHAMPPMKRFRDMEHLSGGEKTMAALALLFAIHSYQPSPFFVLDEVDAALDNNNVQKISNYIRSKAGPGFQFIVISLKTGLFQHSEALVGIFRDQEIHSSKCLTLDLRQYRG